MRPERFVSTGALPDPTRAQRWLDEVHARYADLDEGRCSSVYPALARADPRQFGLCVVTTTGASYCAGQADAPFAIMSVSKPFVFALACERLGVDVVRDRLGVDATGLPFDSLEAVERGGGTTNPMVNAGAIVCSSLVEGDDADERFSSIREELSRLAGRALDVDEDVLASARATNARNQALAQLLRSVGRLDADPAEAVDLYTRQCCLRVTARDLATMGATLADGGVQPVTGERVIDAEVCHAVLAVMVTAGMYEASGRWLYDVGLPAKSGIAGGIVTVSPGKGGLGVFSPPLDDAGNSVRGQAATRALSRRLGLDLLASVPSTQGDAPDDEA